MKIYYRNTIVRTAYVLIDIFCIGMAIFLACKLRPQTIPFDPTFLNIFLFEGNPFRYIFSSWLIITLLFLNTKPSLYQTRREMLEGFEIGLLIQCIILSSCVVIFVLYAWRLQEFPRSILLIGTVLIIFFLSTWRVAKRAFVEYLVSQGYNNSYVLIIGAGKVGHTLVHEIRKRPGLGMKIVGFLDDFKINTPNSQGLKVFGKISNFVEVARHEFVDRVFVTTHLDGQVFLDLLEQAKELGVAVRVVPHGFELMSGDFLKYNIGIIPILEYRDAAPLRIQLSKRIFDLFVISLAMPLFLSIFLFLAILIKLDSRGPIFYVSKRYGRGGHIFYMVKFRSMHCGADQMMEQIRNRNEVDGPIFKIKDDPRVTRVGKWLRKFSLDELPQILNVLKGDMSLVGPRPLPIDQIHKEDLRQLKRLQVRPGITGLWQVRGRSDISFQRLLKWDIWYINNWSFWLDLNILWQTIPVVFKGSGAY